ncbi:unnamed protein product [Peronospora belbahrii]|uniref:Uncharacterized protein n=1 Tax=Peronospora belbahrii TaxID=622444 RepID=A0ABN8CPT7_9STRA|nr:unnamed protein product [Peronospora belbahrii]
MFRTDCSICAQKLSRSWLGKETCELAALDNYSIFLGYMVRQSPLLSFFSSRNLVKLEDIELVSTEIFGLFQLLTEDDDTNSSKSSVGAL